MSPFLLLAALASSLSAETGRTGGALLQQPFGARPFALGQAYSAVGADVFAMTYNPASLGLLQESQVATELVQSVVDTRLGYAGAATPLSPTQSLGVSLSYLDAGRAEIFDAGGNSVSQVAAQRDLLVQLGYAHSWALRGGRLSLGAAAKTLRSVIAQEASATAYAADAGGFYELPWRGGKVSGAAALANLGPGIRYSGGLASGSESDPLPLTARFGLGYARPAFAADAVVFGIQLDRVFHDDKLFGSFGLEYDYHRLFALRLGYRPGEDAAKLRFGVGVRYKSLSVDYGMGLVQAFNNIQQVSMTYRFKIPGVRYDAAQAPKTLETLARNVQTRIASGRFFDAAAEVDRINAFFPEASEATRFKYEMGQAIDAILLQGQTSPRYQYALAYKAYSEKQWQEAADRLKAALKADPRNSELADHLRIAEKNLEGERKQMTLQQQARTSILFELANQAFEAGDYQRALRIANEILRMGPYQPAESLKARIQEKKEKPETPEPPPAPVGAPPQSAPASDEDIAEAERLYYEAVRSYAEDDPEKAREYLQKGLQLNPNSQAIQRTFQRIERERKGR